MLPTNAASRPSGTLPSQAPSKILLVDDHDLLRLGFRALVQAQAGSTGAAIDMLEAGRLDEALAIYATHEETIGLVFLDLGLPDTEGLSGLRAFRERFPAARIVVLSGTGNSTWAQRALDLGAAAFLPKSADLKEVVSFIRATGLLDAAAFACSRGSLDGDAGAPTPMPQQQLTPRQAQVLHWVLQGKPNKEIAQLANVSEGTVKNHVSTLLLLYGVRSRAQLISNLR